MNFPEPGNMVGGIGKTLILLGGLLILFGALFLFLERILPRWREGGFLPGDIFIRRDGFVFFAPIATSIVLSILLSLLLTLFFWLFSGRR